MPFLDRCSFIMTYKVRIQFLDSLVICSRMWGPALLQFKPLALSCSAGVLWVNNTHNLSKTKPEGIGHLLAFRLHTLVGIFP